MRGIENDPLCLGRGWMRVKTEQDIMGYIGSPCIITEMDY